MSLILDRDLHREAKDVALYMGKELSEFLEDFFLYMDETRSKIVETYQLLEMEAYEFTCISILRLIKRTQKPQAITKEVIHIHPPLDMYNMFLWGTLGDHCAQQEILATRIKSYMSLARVIHLSLFKYRVSLLKFRSSVVL